MFGFQLQGVESVRGLGLQLNVSVFLILGRGYAHMLHQLDQRKSMGITDRVADRCA